MCGCKTSVAQQKMEDGRWKKEMIWRFMVVFIYSGDEKQRLLL